MPYAETPDGPLYYEHVRFQPPWQRAVPVLLHHGIALSCDFWYDWLPTLAARFPVVRFDWRGYGRSHVPGPGYPWSLEQFGRDALTVLAAAGYERCHFVGESMGGTTGLYLASHAPERIATLAVASTAFRGRAVQGLGDWAATFAAGGGAAWSRLMMPRRLDLARVDPALAAWFEREQAQAAPHVVLEHAAVLRGADLTDDLARIRAPLLVLAAADSPFVGRAIGDELHARVPGSEIAYFPGARHAVISSHARACAEAVVAFIERRAEVGA
ncbi:MAG TPA: alpha/beta hydrolase [Chloroflexota bacterium]